MGFEEARGTGSDQGVLDQGHLVFQGRNLEFDLALQVDQGAEPILTGRGFGGLVGSAGFGETGDYLRVDFVGLCEAAHGFRKLAHPAGLDHTGAILGVLEGAQHPALVTAGGFANDHGVRADYGDPSHQFFPAQGIVCLVSRLT